VKSEGSELKGKLIEVTDKEITIEWSERVPKEVGKGKQTASKRNHCL